MAEERIIDDDLNRNRKYKIRKNADGEDELYIDDTVEEENLEEVTFNVAEFPEDGELTPEQIAAAEEEKLERAERIKSSLSVNLEKAKAKLDEGDFNGAKEYVEKSLLLDPSSGAAWAIKLCALTQNFHSFEELDEGVEAAENIAKFCNSEQLSELSEKLSPLEEREQKLGEEAAALHVEVEQKKAERREVFAADKRKSLKLFTIVGVPFLTFFVLTIVFAVTLVDLVNVYGVNLVLTIVFGSIALVLFVVTVIFARKLWGAMKKLSLNEKNSSTQMGREYEKLRSEHEKLIKILSSLKAV